MSRVGRNHENDVKNYKKARKKSKNKKGLFKSLISTLIIVGLIAVAVCGVYAGVCITKAPSINPKTIYNNINLSSTIYDDNNKQVDSVYLYENRNIVRYEELPENLKNAFVAIEDERFYTHNGIDIQGIMRAGVKALTSGDLSQGASTITQQLLKNNVFTTWTSESSKVEKFKR